MHRTDRLSACLRLCRRRHSDDHTHTLDGVDKSTKQIQNLRIQKNTSIFLKLESKLQKKKKRQQKLKSVEVKRERWKSKYSIFCASATLLATKCTFLWFNKNKNGYHIQQLLGRGMHHSNGVTFVRSPKVIDYEGGKSLTKAFVP